jgi:hypothetical protein
VVSAGGRDPFVCMYESDCRIHMVDMDTFIQLGSLV